MEIVKIREKWGGMRGSKYFYVAEGSELIHIGEYAIKKYPDPQREKEIIHEILRIGSQAKRYMDFTSQTEGTLV